LACKSSKARKRTYPRSWRLLSDLHPKNTKEFATTVGRIAVLLLFAPGSTKVQEDYRSSHALG
jgi:hypothetical protein